MSVCWYKYSGDETCGCFNCKSCRGKKKYERQYEAQVDVANMNAIKKTSARKVTWYNCKQCGHIHVGHRVNKARAKKRNLKNG